MTTLNISKTLSLPIDFVTSTHAILAKKRSGKSYAAQVLAEELLAAGQQVIAFDPTGAWWGLRSSTDGKSPGFPIAVLGGEHGDVPLEATAGEVIAEAVVSDRFSAVIDTSLFTVGEEQRFAAAFLATLYRKNREPMHLFVDEADVFAPQKPFGEEAKTLGAMQNVVRRGGIRGIGCTLITQRPQVLNKDVLSQVDMLTTLRMNHPKDLGAIEVWVAVHGDPAEAKKMIASLPSLPVGEAWIWAPAQELFERVAIRQKTTFDSGRTPKAGEHAASPKVLAQVDIARLGKTIAATVEHAKANDPKLIKAEWDKLKRDFEALKAQKDREFAAAVPVERIVEVPILTAGELLDLKGAVQLYETTSRTILRELETVGMVVRDLQAAIDLAGQLPTKQERAKAALHDLVVNSPFQMPRQVPPAPARARLIATGSGPGDPTLKSGERKILTALAQYPNGRTKQQVAILTGYAHTGGGFNNYVSALRTRGLVGDMGEQLVITPTGTRALGSYSPLPTGTALFQHWQGQLGKAEREILRVLFEEWPDSRPKEYVAVKAGYAPDGGGFNNALSRLRTLELIEGKAKLKASDQLQDGAA